jgi:hypothetical protein
MIWKCPVVNPYAKVSADLLIPFASLMKLSRGYLSEEATDAGGSRCYEVF